MIRFALCLLVLCFSLPLSAQDCPNGQCTIQQSILAPRLTPVRSVLSAAADVASVPVRAWNARPMNAGGSTGRAAYVPTYAVVPVYAAVKVGGSTGRSAGGSTGKVTTTRTVTRTRSYSVQGQAKADEMASSGVMRHIGRPLFRYEGVGFSTVSADDAIRNCCYWGQRPVAHVNVARGRRGFYAVVGYN